MWHDPAGSWRPLLEKYLRNRSQLLQGFKRVPSAKDDKRLTLVAPSKKARQHLLCAIRELRGSCRANMFLTPPEKANKALAYRLLDKRPVHVKEMGDALQVTY